MSSGPASSVKKTEKGRRWVGGRERRKEGERKVQVFTDWTWKGALQQDRAAGPAPPLQSFLPAAACTAMHL